MRTLRMLFSSDSLQEQRAVRRVSRAVREADADAVLYCTDVAEQDVDASVQTPVIAVDDEHLFRGVPHDMERIEELLR